MNPSRETDTRETRNKRYRSENRDDDTDDDYDPRDIQPLRRSKRIAQRNNVAASEIL